MKFALLSGAHSHTAGYINQIKENPDWELVAVWDDMASRGQKIADEMGCEIYADLDKALGQGDVDATIICADNAGHRPLVEASAAKGIDLFCEKPMALSVADADAMLKAIQNGGVHAVFGYFQPFSGHAQKSAELVASGGLGQITQLHYRNAHHAAYGHWFDSEDRRWFTRPEQSGGGAFLDMGTHAVHFVRTIFGPVTSVSAMIANKSGVYPDVDDHGIALFEFENGATGVIEASWVFTAGPRGLEAVGSGGRLALYPDLKNQYSLQFTQWKDNQAQETVELPPAEPLPSGIARLIALREGKLDPQVNEQDLHCCRDAVAIMEAAYRSAATGQRQTVQ